MGMSILEAINENPLAGSMVLVALLIINQIVKAWRGKDDTSKLEQENNKLAKQTSETVNSCAARTHEVMEVIEEFVSQNDLGYLSNRLDHAVSLLEKMGQGQGVSAASLDRITGLCNSIIRNLERADSRVVHATLLNNIEIVKGLVEDVKRIAIQIASESNHNHDNN